jgi:hypothetical protein
MMNRKGNGHIQTSGIDYRLNLSTPILPEPIVPISKQQQKEDPVNVLITRHKKSKYQKK